MRFVCWQCVCLTLLWISAAPTRADEAGERFYLEKVKPILETSCYKCHGGDKVKGGLRLNNSQGLRQGGDTGPAIDAKDASKSLLLKAIRYESDDLQMPPKGKLPPEQIGVIEQWLRMGVPMPAGEAPAAEPVHSGPPVVNDEAKQFWSFKPVTRPAIPVVKQSSWVRNPIDAFILAKLDEKGLAPAKEADRNLLIRRVTYDLTGLPPTPAEVKAFVEDSAPDAYDKLIDRLLASPHYGEKWGQHWLDLVRYAETNSYERDGAKPHVWRYRDYVIRSFNQNKPYDVFLQEQLAGDEMPDAAENPDRVIATGFYRLGIWDDEPSDRLQARYDMLDDIVATTGQVFLGLTVDCARCHDHKIDPFPQADYYRLLAFFQNINHYRNGGPTDEVAVFTSAGGRESFEARAKERQLRRGQVEGLIKEVQRDFYQLITGEAGRGAVSKDDVPKLILKEGLRVLGKERFDRYLDLRKEDEELKKPMPGSDMALAVTEAGPTAPDTFIMMRGNANVPGAKVEAGFPQVLGGEDVQVGARPAGARTCGRRSLLARWMTAPTNPLTARVMANRIWQYHFGRGIVRSASNFGYGGDRPTHPELLDWLASEFVAKGWDIKAMHRLIMTSAAYRMSSHGDAKALAVDPRNDWMWRYDLRRLTAEELRDSVLKANGTLNLKLGGPSVYPPIPKEVMQGQSRPGEGWHTSTGEEACRRSVYIHVKRALRVPIIEAFDAAENDKSCPVRFVTIQPTQALGMLNSRFMNDEATKFAARLRREAGEDVSRQVSLALQLVLCRKATEREVARGVGLVADLRKEGASDAVAMKDFCLMALSLNEFVFVD